MCNATLCLWTRIGLTVIRTKDPQPLSNNTRSLEEKN